MRGSTQYDDGLDADGYPLEEGGWRKPYRHGDENDAGDFVAPTVGMFCDALLERAEHFSRLRGSTDSPIEDMVGAALLMRSRARRIDLRLFKGAKVPPGDGLLLIPQFRWGIYRSDWALVTGEMRGVLLIECDGKEFHSAPDRIEHDQRKDRAALDRGWLTLRFTGSEINRDADGIADKILELATA